MNSKAEDAVLDFLTSDENLPFVLDILKRGKQIRRMLIRDFWMELHQHLGERAAATPSGAISSLKYSVELVDKLIDKGEAGLYYFSPTIETAKQCLSYCVYHERDGDGLNLWYGLAWEKEIGRDSPLTELKPVRTFKKVLQSAEFKSTEWCLGYKIISQHETIEDFLAAVAKDRESMLHQIEDVFLPFVQETAKMVEEANQAVLGEAKH